MLEVVQFSAYDNKSSTPITSSKSNAWDTIELAQAKRGFMAFMT